MELYQLRYFLSVAAHKNITRAAAESGITQTAMSEQMRKLEHSLGAPLLHRGRRHTTLTDAGEALASHAESLLRQAKATQDFVADVAGLRAGSLNVGAIPSVGAGLLPEALKRFHTLHPAIRLHMREETSAQVARLVESGEVDVGVAQLPLARGSFTQAPLLTEPFCVLVASGHRLTSQSAVPLSDLARENLLLPRGRARQSALEACRTAGFEPRLSCESGELETIRALVRAGLGVALLPALAAKNREKGTRVLPLSGRIPRRKLVLLTSKKASPSSLALRFAGILKECAQLLARTSLGGAGALNP
jgi:DNA-binding transcriptional LysR family regulator